MGILPSLKHRAILPTFQHMGIITLIITYIIIIITYIIIIIITIIITYHGINTIIITYHDNTAHYCDDSMTVQYAP